MVIGGLFAAFVCVVGSTVYMMHSQDAQRIAAKTARSDNVAQEDSDSLENTV